MSTDLTSVTSEDIARLGEESRQTIAGTPTLESAARALCRHLHDELAGPNGTPACVLTRCFSTVRYDALPTELQRIAKRALGAVAITPPEPAMRCLVLLGTVGEEPEWNDRRSSRGHQAIPLPSPYVVERAPMIARLIRELGLDLTQVIRPGAASTRPGGALEGVFHVEDAAGSRYIPAQQGFVDRYGIRSVIGFGSILASGELLATLLFTRVSVPPAVAERFGRLAREIVEALGPTPRALFDQAATAGQ
jgi:hypothetical protein